MCMDRRRLTALVFSGRLFNPRCMAALWRGFIHLGGDVWKHTLRLEQKENGGPSVFLPVVLRWQLQARRQRRQDFRQTEAAGVCADWYAAPKSFRRNCRLSDFYFQRNFRRLLRWSFRSP